MKSIKILVSSILVSLTFLIPQIIYGMERFSEDEEQKGTLRTSQQEEPKESLKLERESKSKGRKYDIVDMKDGKSFIGIPNEILIKIFNFLELKEKLLCSRIYRKANEILLNENIKHLKNLEAKFLSGELYYKPEGQSDAEMVKLELKELQGPVDLSECGDLAKHLSISTGCPTVVDRKIIDMTQVWVCPRHLALKGAPDHPYLGKIIKKWDGSEAGYIMMIDTAVIQEDGPPVCYMTAIPFYYRTHIEKPWGSKAWLLSNDEVLGLYGDQEPNETLLAPEGPDLLYFPADLIKPVDREWGDSLDSVELIIAGSFTHPVNGPPNSRLYIGWEDPLPGG